MTPERRRARALTAADQPRPWEAPVVNAALAIGLILMAIQLWILTVALDLLLGAGPPERLWHLAVVSGGVFAGGLVVLELLRKRPRLGA